MGPPGTALQIQIHRGCLESDEACIQGLIQMAIFPESHPKAMDASIRKHSNMKKCFFIVYLWTKKRSFCKLKLSRFSKWTFYNKVFLVRIDLVRCFVKMSRGPIVLHFTSDKVETARCWNARFLTTGGNWWWSPISMTLFNLQDQ